MKKPLYANWWFWLIVFFVAIAIYGAITGVNQAKDDLKNSTVNKDSDVNNDLENDAEDNDSNNDTEDVGENTVKEHDKLTFAEFTIDSIRTEISDDELTLKFHWINQSGEDKMPFTVLGYIDVSQDGEQLDEISGAYDSDNKLEILFRNANGGRHPVTLVYELENKEDVRLLFGTTLEESDKKETITIEID